MVEQIKKYKISVYGESYTVISDEPEEHILKSANLVDCCMKEICQSRPQTQVSRIAVLVAMQMASKMLESVKKLDYQKKEFDKLIQKIDQIDQFSQFAKLEPVPAQVNSINPVNNINQVSNSANIVGLETLKNF